ncbi:MAG: EMC3/TMCO1 family protein [Thermoplasmata archaeon]|nr:EMC3/TMCO1 family protein [Thermoplasmata archaeon]
MADNPTPQPSGSASSQMLMMMMIFGTMFIMFIPSLRDAVGNTAGIILEPLIGFNGNFPVMTVLLAGLTLVAFSSAVRHYFIDWTDTAEKQFKMKDFNKILREARLAGNDAEVKKLTAKQMEMSKDQMMSTFDQMKPMMFTMIFLIATFAFISTFIGNIPGATMSVPWSNNVDMNASLSSNACCGFSNWMILYSLISMSVAQVIQRVFKWYSFNKALKDPDTVRFKKIPVQVDDSEDDWEESEEIENAEDDDFLIIEDDSEEPDENNSGDEESEVIKPLSLEEEE